MSEQLVNVNPLKQYLLTVDEIGLAYLTKLMPMIKYLEVEGMTIVDQPNHHLLVTPKPKAAEELNKAEAEVVDAKA